MKALLIALIFSISGPAEREVSSFNGTWRVDVGSLSMPAAPEVILLKGGMFSIGGQRSTSSIKADGRFHMDGGDGYIDEVAVKILDRNSIRETDKLGGKIVYTTTYRVSADGMTMIARSTDFTKPDGKPVMTERLLRRIGRPARGAHLISGSWRTTKLKVSTESYLNWTLRVEGDRFSSSSTNGYGFDAIIGGPPVPVRGDTAGALKAVTMPAKDTIVETASLNGVVGSVMTLTMLPEGKSIKVTSQNVKEGTSVTFMLYKR